jgi:SPP1 family predicted phage head-tail adaptor
MTAGRLNKRVTFQQQVRTPDGGGGAALTWGNDIEVWGGFAPERGQERLEAGRLEAALAGVLKVRYSSEIAAVDASWSVTIDGERHQIRSISNPDQKTRIVEMTVERGVANG